MSQENSLQLDAVNTKRQENNIITAGQPSEKDILTLKEAGVMTVINLRADGEDLGFDQKKVVENSGMTYIHIPVAGAAGMTKSNAEYLDKALAKNKGTIFVHCGTSNRVGGLLALRAYYLDNKNSEQAMEIGKASGLTGLESAVSALMEP